MRKSALGFISIFIFVLSLSLSYSAETSPYKIGVNFELTGPWAEITKTLRNAMVLEVERINQRGGINGKPLELIFEDNGFEAGRAAANMTKFTKNPEVLLVVGPFEDTLQATTRAIAEREKITNIIVCPSNKVLREMKQRWAFNMAHNDIIVSEKLVDLSLARKYKKILVFHAAHPLAQTLAEYYKRFGEEKGLKVFISPETHKHTDIDMTPQLIKMKPLIEKEKIDAFYACTSGPPGPIVCKNLRALGMKLPILGTHAFGFGFIIALGGEAMEGVEFPGAKPVVYDQLDENDPAKSINLEFDKRWRGRYGTPSDQIAGYGHDIIGLIEDSIKRIKGKVTRETFRNALENTKGFKGTHGLYSFRPAEHDGLSKKDLVFVRIEGGRFKRIRFPGFE
jgi:branched-chain amino acid transport system substrate-binding protein